MGLFDFLKKRKPEKPLRLMAQSAEEVVVVASLIQDAALREVGLNYDPKGRHFTMRMNRFCHERNEATPLRAASVLQIHDVLAVKSKGIDLRRRVTALSLLTLEAEVGEDGMYRLILKFAGGQNPELRIDVECLDILLMDLAPPHRAQSLPDHQLSSEE